MNQADNMRRLINLVETAVNSEEALDEDRYMVNRFGKKFWQIRLTTAGLPKMGVADRVVLMDARKVFDPTQPTEPSEFIEGELISFDSERDEQPDVNITKTGNPTGKMREIGFNKDAPRGHRLCYKDTMEEYLGSKYVVFMEDAPPVAYD